MFTLTEKYDVQETRRIARDEGIKKGRNEGKLEAAINIIKEFQATVTKAMEVTELPALERENLIKELKHNNIPYTL